MVHVTVEVELVSDLGRIDVASDRGLIELIDGQLAQVILGRVVGLLSVLLVDLEETVFLEFFVVDFELIVFIENEMKDPFCLDSALLEGLPDALRHGLDLLLGLAAVLWEYQHLFQGDVEVFLTIVKRRVIIYLALPSFLRFLLLRCLFDAFFVFFFL